MKRLSVIILLVFFMAMPVAAQSGTAAPDKERADDSDRCTSNLDTLIFQLLEKDAVLRWFAADCLAELKDRRAVQPLVSALYAEEYPRLALIEARALKEINDPTATSLLLQGLKDSRTRVRAIEALGRLDAPEAVQPLLNILGGSRNADERHRVVMALGNIHDPRVLQPLIRGLRDKDEILRRYAALSLGDLGDVGAAHALILALRDPDGGVRWNSVVSLGQLKAVSGISSLGGVVNDNAEDNQIRKAAADSLGNIGDAEAVPYLARAFRGSPSGVQWHVAAALAHFQTEEVEELLTNSLRQGEYSIVAAAHKYFILKGDELSTATLVAAIREHGYHEMGDDFISSGNPKLIEAGKDWKARNESEDAILLGE